MFRLWGKQFSDGRMIADTVVCDDSDSRRTQKVFGCLEKICLSFDLQKPIWLDNTVLEFQKMGKARFYQDNFIEEIPFDYLEIQVLEDD